METVLEKEFKYSAGDIQGAVNENVVFLALHWRISFLREIALETRHYFYYLRVCGFLYKGQRYL